MESSKPAARKRSARPLRLEEDAPNKHQVKTDETRRKLLKSARKIFVQHGFEAARIEDISRDSGHTRGAFYAHFTSKEDLFFALLEQQIYQQLEKLQTLLDAEPDSAAKLRVLRGYYVARLLDPHWSMLMLEFKLFAARHSKSRARLASVHRAMRASVQVQKIADLLGGQSGATLSYDTMKIILEAFLQSLILQRTYDPLTLSASDACEALGRVFDLLVMNR